MAGDKLTTAPFSFPAGGDHYTQKLSMGGMPSDAMIRVCDIDSNGP